MTRRPCNSLRARNLTLFLALSTFWAPPPLDAGERFVRGDANQSGEVDMSDAIRILGWRFRSEPAPDCLDAADVNDDGGVDLSDTVYVLSRLFRGGAPPAAPFPECGEDPTDDDLGCLDPSACPPASLRIFGRVVDVDGAPLDALSIDGGIVLSIGEDEIRTDDAGGFAVERERGTTDEILLSVRAAGFTSSQRIVHVEEGRSDYQVAVTLLEVGIVVVVEDLSDGATIDLGGETPARVVIPAGAIPWSGPVRVAVTALDPTLHPKAAPGDSLRAVDPEDGDESVTLESFGMLEVTITDVESGEDIHELDAPARIELPVPDALLGKVSGGDVIPLWYLDEATALWVQEGEGEVLDVDGRLVLSGEVTHFTWWNWDRISDRACIRMTFSGDLVTHGTIGLGVEGITFGGRFRGSATANDGEWDLVVARSTPTEPERSRLAAEVQGVDYYLEETSAGTLALTIDAARALVLDSPTTPWGQGADCDDRGSYLIESDLPPSATLASNRQVFCVGEPATVETITLFAEDPDGEIASISWDADAALTLSHVSDTIVNVETPGTVGQYVVSVVVRDDDGNSSETRRTIYVTDCTQEVTPFVRGDANGDRQFDYSDAVAVWSSLPFIPRGTPDGPGVDCGNSAPNPGPPFDLLCDDAADANDDGVIDCSDGVYIASFLFGGGPRPSLPFGECGLDPTADGLTCVEYFCP